MDLGSAIGILRDGAIVCRRLALGNFDILRLLQGYSRTVGELDLIAAGQCFCVFPVVVERAVKTLGKIEVIKIRMKGKGRSAIFVSLL